MLRELAGVLGCVYSAKQEAHAADPLLIFNTCALDLRRQKLWALF